MTKDTKPDAWMPLYIGDWEGDTGHLDCEQDGAYMRLVRWYWRKGPPKDDDATLARIIRMPLGRWRKIRDVLADFFTVANGVWRHKRVDEELIRWSEKRARAIERAAAGGRAKAAKAAPESLLVAPNKQPPSSPQAVLKSCTSASSTEVDAHKGQSTLCSRDAPEARLDGASGLRVIEGGISELVAWDVALAEARTDLAHFSETDPDFASEIAEFIAVASEKLIGKERVA